jgi:hypothetical protein
MDFFVLNFVFISGSHFCIRIIKVEITSSFIFSGINYVVSVNFLSIWLEFLLELSGPRGLFFETFCVIVKFI